MKLLSLDEIVKRIENADLKSARPRIIAIDGPAGAGKTTLAKRISDSLIPRNTAVVHMDDLYNGWDDALTPQLSRTLVNQILTPVSQGKSFGYRKYDWFSGAFQEFRQFDPPYLLILEGVGSGQKAVRKFTDELIWIEIQKEVGLRRVLGRDGDYLEAEMRVWQFKEEEHFNIENTRDCATIRLDGNFFL